jgi:hypothetical protein
LDFVAKHWGDLASLLGLACTIWLAYRAKTAAEQARDAAKAARVRISSLNAVSELTAARPTLAQIIGLQRLDSRSIPWAIVLDRYESARLSLVRCEQAAGLREAQRGSIAKAAARLRIIVEEIEAALNDPEQGQLDIVRLNRFLSAHIDDIERARTAIERTET